MTTRSATKAQRVEEEEAAEPSLLIELSPEILNIIALKLHDVLLPHYLGHLSRTCKVIRAAVYDRWDQHNALYKLRVKHQAVRELADKCGDTIRRLGRERPTRLNYSNKGLVPADVPALVSVLKSDAMAQLKELNLNNPYPNHPNHGQNRLGDDGITTLATAAAGGGLPRLTHLYLHSNNIGDAGMQALSSAFAGGAFPELVYLVLAINTIGDAGLISFAEALENDALPKLQKLYIQSNFPPGFGVAGVKALMTAAGRGKLSKLQVLVADYTGIGEEGVEAIAETIDEGKLPSLTHLSINHSVVNPRLYTACEARGIYLNVGESESGSEQGEDADESEEEDESEGEDEE